MAKYRDDLADESEVTWLDTEEYVISDVFFLSLSSGLSGQVCNYEVVKDYCKENKLDTIEVYRVCKSMTSELNKK